MTLNPYDIDLALARGGPFYTILRSLHLTGPDGRRALRPALACVAIGWLPTALIAIVDRLATGRIEPLMGDPTVHVRLVIAIPLFFTAEALLDELSGVAMKRFLRGPYGGDPHTIEKLVHETERLRDSVLPEAIMLTLSLVMGQFVLWGGGGASGFFSGAHGEVANFSPARLWYGVIALPLFFFLQFRFLYGWALWARILAALSRSKLDLVPTHPDLAGGLGALAEPVPAFAAFVLGNNAIVATSWGEEMTRHGAHLKSFAPIFGAAVIGALLLALAPLCVFVRRLWNGRLEGLRQYSRVAFALTRAFHQRWVANEHDEAILDSGNPSALIDMQSAYQNLERMRIVPFGPRSAVLVFAAALLPVLPLLAVEVPIEELFTRIGGAMLGGLPP
jgi:hypothetical protein